MQTHSSITERIVEQANKLKLKQIDIVRATGASRATVNKWFSHLNKPSAKYLDKIADLLEVTTEWLLTGEGSMRDAQRSYNKAHEISVRRIPRLNWVQAGLLEDVCDNIYDEFDEIFDNGTLGDCIFSLVIKGDSMEPEFFEGDIIVVDQDRCPKVGDYVIAIAANENQATFKKFKPCGMDEETRQEYYQLVPLNNFYPVIDSRIQHFEIRGVVIQHIRSF